MGEGGREGDETNERAGSLGGSDHFSRFHPGYCAAVSASGLPHMVTRASFQIQNSSNLRTETCTTIVRQLQQCPSPRRPAHISPSSRGPARAIAPARPLHAPIATAMPIARGRTLHRAMLASRTRRRRSEAILTCYPEHSQAILTQACFAPSD